jgi:acyl-CoA synthetase (NDP forming)
VSGTIERLLADDGNDAAIFVVGSSAQFNPELAVEPLLRFAGSKKPFAVALTPAAEKSLALLTAAGVPAFRHPESCARGDGALPAAADAATRADSGRACVGGTRGLAGRPRGGLRRTARDGAVRGAWRAGGKVGRGA